jgi:hypothetical protein
MNKYARQINTITHNGLNILAGIYDEVAKIYIATPYEKKRISCHSDPLSRTISSDDEITLAFCILDER